MVERLRRIVSRFGNASVRTRMALRPPVTAKFSKFSAFVRIPERFSLSNPEFFVTSFGATRCEREGS